MKLSSVIYFAKWRNIAFFLLADSDTDIAQCSKGMTDFKSDIQNFGYFLFFLDLYTIIYVYKEV